MEKIQTDDLTGISETLLIPLHYRVEESKSDLRPFRDEMGERLHDAIDYDWNRFPVESFLRQIIAVRTVTFDREVKQFLEKVPDALVVNLGAGLDTRFYRLDNGVLAWAELDLPNVITFRQKLREPPSKRHWLVGASVLDPLWFEEIKQHARKRVLFVAEGLFPYFSEDEHKKIFASLAENFPGQEMLFQTLAYTLIQDLGASSNVLSRMKSDVELRWGLNDSTQVSSLNPKVRFMGELSLFEGRDDLLPASFRLKLSPEKIRNLARVVHVRF